MMVDIIQVDDTEWSSMPSSRLFTRVDSDWIIEVEFLLAQGIVVAYFRHTGDVFGEMVIGRNISGLEDIVVLLRKANLAYEAFAIVADLVTPTPISSRTLSLAGSVVPAARNVVAQSLRYKRMPDEFRKAIQQLNYVLLTVRRTA